MSRPAPVRAVVLDIEGTTGSLTHVRDVLFPYARSRLAAWLTDHQHSPQGQELLSDIGADAGSTGSTLSEAIRRLESWSDQDVKAPALKTVQAAVWREGYRRGELTGHVYPDVPVALSRWKSVGIARYVYSSGAVPAQQDWFAHTAHGDLTPLLDGYFDLTSAGAKHRAGSYRVIERAVGVPAAHLLFASDVVAELDAAREAGWQTLAVRRPDDPRGPVRDVHPCVPSLDDRPTEPLREST